MTAMNIVRMRTKPGHEKAYLDLHRNRPLSDLAGLTALRIVKTGANEYVFVGEWTSMDALAAARPAMIATLDQFRDSLEVLGPDIGVTEPRSGEVVVSRAL